MDTLAFDLITVKSEPILDADAVYTCWSGPSQKKELSGHDMIGFLGPSESQITNSILVFTSGRAMNTAVTATTIDHNRISLLMLRGVDLVVCSLK